MMTTVPPDAPRKTPRNVTLTRKDRIHVRRNLFDAFVQSPEHLTSVRKNLADEFRKQDDKPLRFSL